MLKSVFCPTHPAAQCSPTATAKQCAYAHAVVYMDLRRQCVVVAFLKIKATATSDWMGQLLCRSAFVHGSTESNTAQFCMVASRPVVQHSEAVNRAKKPMNFSRKPWTLPILARSTRFASDFWGYFVIFFC